MSAPSTTAAYSNDTPILDQLVALPAGHRSEGNIMSKDGGIIGISDHGGWAVLVTVARDGTLLDRRRVELVGDGLPKLPHHSEGQRLPLDEAVELVECVRVSAERHAALALDAVTRAVLNIPGIALRQCPQLPPTIAQRIQDYRAQNVADWVMYRKALASAAETQGWPVHLVRRQERIECGAPGVARREPQRSLPPGAEVRWPPWDKDHKLAMAAIVTASAVVDRSA